ncbi:family 2 encapsulin nanocompartment cargo protein polyprenyl transferase [Streptomyces canus]|uniref:family 2 encapsulin nanocompartment cargo protein polyprenyl transferase n=1 Tax=Streptomyces canus TaxID=58343 RepID=UPI00371EB586
MPSLHGPEARPIHGSEVRTETPSRHGPEARPIHGSEVRAETPSLHGPDPRAETPALDGPDPRAETPALDGPGPPAETPALDGPDPRAETPALDGHEAGVILERVRASVDPELRSALESLPRSLRRVALYHFGWEHADGTPAAGNAGKAIRPALVLTAATALGGDRARAAAVRAAVAVELVHNFTLLHDDVMDRDTTRRHRPTAWTVFGDADAILAGDALQALALRLLAEDPHPAAGAAAARLADCVVELCEGQHEDTAMEALGPGEVTLDQVLVMAEAKTGALLGCACALGALYAGASGEEVGAMDAFGRESGLAFQLIDDVIGIWGDPNRTGKPAGADLAARKKSLPVVAALTSGTAAAAELAALYTAPYEEGDLARTALAVEEAGGRDWAQVQAADRMARAMGQLARAVPDPEAAGGLLSLAEFVTRRSA